MDVQEARDMTEAYKRLNGGRMKAGDLLLWYEDGWRWEGKIFHIDYVAQYVDVGVQTVFQPGKGPTNHLEDKPDFRELSFEMFLEERKWMIKRAADYRMKIQARGDSRRFRIFGRGEGISDKDGFGGGLRYMNTETLSQ